MSSEHYDWLIPEPGESFKSRENIFHDLVHALCGIERINIRPRWQEEPPRIPDANASWCAFGIISAGAPGASVWHEGGCSRLESHWQTELLFSFYGPCAREKAKALRDGLWVEQNRGILRFEHNIALLRMGELRIVPELYGERWLMRCDLAITFVIGPKITEQAEGRLDIKDLKEAKACEYCINNFEGSR